MAFSLRAGTNWCHDFPKLARESGFYFNMHRTKVRVDWNRISTIDIDSVIRDRDFLTIDENVNNVVDYSLENEYDVKILDPNFVKLFRLSQLAVEYLLYCKQYLDHSVIILKDELRLKLEENGKLKKDLLTAEENIQELKDKFKDKQKYIEAKFSDSHGEIHKCPQCPKTFISSVFMNSHLTRRHSNVTISSPEHEKYRAEAEKLNNEIKNLKERLNETERLIRNDTIKKFDNDLSNDIKNSLSIDRSIYQEKKIEDEHRRYREEISNLKSMLFNELRNLKSNDNDKKLLENDDTFGNTWKEQIRQQENEIKILKDNIQIRTNQDIENIKLKLNSQEEFWLTKINDINKQHKFDIDKLYKQLKINEQSWDYMKNDYLKKINDLEEMYKAELSKNNNIDSKNSHDHDINNPLNPEKVLSITDKKRSIIIDPIETENPRDSFIQRRDKKLSLNAIEIDDNHQDKKSPSVEVKYDQWQDQTEIILSEKTRIPEPVQQVFVKKSMSSDKTTSLMTKKFEESLSDSDDSDTQSETMTTSKVSSDESDETSESLDDNDDNDEDKNNKPVAQKNREQLKLETKDNVEQKLRDLGVDPDWQGLPYKTYCQLSKIIKHHRNINKKKYTNFDDIRNEIINNVNKKIINNVDDDDVDDKTSNKKLQLNKLLKNVKTKAFRAFNINDNSTNNTIKQKRIIVNKHNIDILPKKIKSPIVSSPELSTKPRYTSSPCKKNYKTVESSVDVKQFSHSYESIKDYLKDPMENKFFNTQNINEIKLSKDGLSSLPASPKNNRSVLKTTTGSVGSLVKKKVEFILDDEKTMYDSSENEFHISSISEEKSDDVKAIDSKKNNDIILKTTQSDKIYEIAKKLETQLNTTRQKPVGAVEAMFMKKLHFTNDDLSINDQNDHYPMPAPRLSISSINQSEKNEMTNLDLDIEELLAME
ncbi:hypothetical protein HCN44_002433 [Aphidius gifuensis]|uniref:C2H2-type domain-containing protein n=2 Tax=Aphidius gifuensis TaxID=684658 RepID=A0A834Y4S7_APHGI|nr:hypothetical protein HCN44_002433 [Aphidius gifuensis]